MTFEHAHILLASYVNPNDPSIPPRTEDRDDPDTVRAMQLIVHLPTDNAPARDELLAAAGIATLKVCFDVRWEEPLRRWYGHLIRKVVRRARGIRWQEAHDLPGCTATVGSASVRALVPGRVDQIPPSVRKMQISGTDVKVSKHPGTTGLVTVLLDASLSMSAGKSAAQVGHATMLWAAAHSADEVRRWRDQDYSLAVREISHEHFVAAAKLPEAVVVRDAGFTEIAPGSCSAVAVESSALR